MTKMGTWTNGGATPPSTSSPKRQNAWLTSTTATTGRRQD